MRSSGIFLTALALSLSMLDAGAATDEWSEAEKAILRVPESAFSDLPERVRHVIRELRCLIPQPGDRVAARGPLVNVISGQFARAGQVDWAFLCSSGGRSAIYVVWGGPEVCPTPLANAADRDYLQGRGGSVIDFSRELIVAGPDQIVTTYRHYGKPPPFVSHDAIEDLFVDKASVRHYCDLGTWRTLLGAD